TLTTADRVTVSGSGNTAGVDFTLPTGAGSQGNAGGIKGRVTDGTNGIPNLPINIYLGNGGLVLSATTDGSGNYNTSRVLAPSAPPPTGTYKLQAGGTSGVPTRWFQAGVPGGALAQATGTLIVVNSNSDTTLADMMLSGGAGGIKGLITADGQPLEGAIVDIFDTNN